jgi:ligand-binding SRPBCC domain-containing protein
MSERILEREQILPRPRSEVFAFFSDAANLQRITPGFLNFRILTPLPIEMRAGAIIEYRIALFGVPMRWRTRIDAWVPEERFVDFQERGPYALWHHTHTFEELPGGRTKMIDRVRYRVPLGPLGDVARVLFVDRTLARIFDHRRETIAAIFGA